MELRTLFAPFAPGNEFSPKCFGERMAVPVCVPARLDRFFASRCSAAAVSFAHIGFSQRTDKSVFAAFMQERKCTQKAKKRFAANTGTHGASIGGKPSITGSEKRMNRIPFPESVFLLEDLRKPCP